METNQQEIFEKADRLMEEFEKPFSIDAASEWKSSLDKRIGKIKYGNYSSFRLSSLTVVIILIVFLNIIIIAAAFLRKSGNPDERKSDFEILSRELFVNSNSLNY